MTMKLENPTRLKVSLDAPELLEYGLTFEEMDYSQAKTKQLLNALLIKAARTTDFKLLPGRMIIETFPANGGGCIIYFTILLSRLHSQKPKAASPKGFVFYNSGDLLDAASAIFLSGAKYSRSSLWKWGEHWILEIDDCSERAAALLREYSEDTAEPPNFPKIHEHGKLICRDAIKIIGSARQKIKD